MIAYASRYSDRLLSALLEHLEIVIITLLISAVTASDMYEAYNSTRNGSFALIVAPFKGFFRADQCFFCALLILRRSMAMFIIISFFRTLLH